MYYVYILKSLKSGRYYIGSCEDTEIRLKVHNSKKVRATKSGAPWIIVLTEFYNTRAEAVRREVQIKSYKSGNAFKKLIIK